MGNAIEKAGAGVAKAKVKTLPHPHLDVQIKQTLEYGNMKLLLQHNSITCRELLSHLPKESPTDPRHAYYYLNAIIKPDSDVTDTDMAEFVEEHPTTQYAYITAAVIESSDPDVKTELLSLPLKGEHPMLGLLIVKLFDEGVSMADKISVKYPIRFPEQLTSDTTDDQLYWLLLSGQDPNSMAVLGDQKERWQKALVRADLYACHENHHITDKDQDLRLMLPAILKRWQYLRKVAPNYLMEIVMPYYRTLFDFYFKHNGLNSITEEDLTLLSLVYPDLLGAHADSWVKQSPLERSLSCLPYHGLYYMLGLDIRFESYHPTNEQVWRYTLTEVISKDPALTLEHRTGQYYGTLLSDPLCKSSITKDGNTTDMRGVDISEYNPCDIVVIYDSKLDYRYYFTRTELPDVLSSKVNPYNQETIGDRQLAQYHDYVKWHQKHVMLPHVWAAQWEILTEGEWFFATVGELSPLLAYYTLGDSATSSGPYQLELTVDPSQTPDRNDIEDMMGMAGKMSDELPEDDPMTSNMRGIFSNISELVGKMDLAIASKNEKSGRIKQIEE